MDVIGHRGLVIPLGPPENTLAAVERALVGGVDGVEVDVRVTRDGAPVCVHDPDLERVARSPVEIARTTYSALHDLRLPGGHRIPTVGEVARRVAGRGTLVLDLKPAGRRTPALVAGVVAAIRDHGRDADIVVSSVDAEVLEAVGRCLPRARRALIVTGSLVAAVQSVPNDVDLHPQLSVALAEAAEVQRLADSGRTLRCWTVNRPVDVRLLGVLGVGAVITDDPASILAPARAADPLAATG